jgi:hypothetical protein
MGVPWEGHVHFFIHSSNEKTTYKPLSLFHLCSKLPHKNKKSNSDTVKICNASAFNEVPKCTVHKVKCWLTRKYNISTVAAYEYKSSITGQMAVSFSLFLHSCLPSTHLIQICKFFTFVHFMLSYICCTQMICRLVILPENMASKQLYSCLWCNFTTTDNLSIWSHSMTIP